MNYVYCPDCGSELLKIVGAVVDCEVSFGENEDDFCVQSTEQLRWGDDTRVHCRECGYSRQMQHFTHDHKYGEVE